jgi:chromosome segregation ATPase
MSLLNYPVAVNKGRAIDPRGYVEADIPLLIELGILKRRAGRNELNPKLKITPDEIKDFLNWVADNKRGAMPPALKKILCLKRAAIVNSALSSGTSSGLRTAHAGRLREIDELLEAGGLGKCESAPAAPSSIVSGPVPSASTSVISDASDSRSLAYTIQSIQESLSALERAPAASSSSEFGELKKLILELMQKAIRADSTLATHTAKLDNILAAIRALPPSTEKTALTAALPAAAATDATGVAAQLASIEKAISTCCSDKSFERIKSMIDELRSEFAEIKALVPRADVADKIDAIHTRIAASGADATTIRDKLSEIQDFLRTNGTRDAIEGRLTTMDAALQTILDRLSRDPSTFENEVRATLDVFRTDISDLRTATISGFETVETEITGARSNIRALGEQIAEMRGECAKSAELTREMNVLNQSIAALRVIIANQRPPADYIQPVLDAIAAQRAALEAQIAALRTGDEGMRRDLETRIARVSALEEELAALRASHDEATTALAARVATIAERERQIGELETQAAAMGAERVRERAELEARIDAQKADCTQQINAARRELGAKFSAERRKLDEELRQLRTLRDSLTQEKVATSTRNATQRNTINRLTAQIESLQTELTRLNGLLKDCESKDANIRELTESLRQAETNATERQREYNAALAEFTAERDRISTENADAASALRTENADLRAQLARMNAEREVLEANLQGRTSSADQTRAEMAKLQARFDEVEATANAAAEARVAEQINNLQEQLRRITEGNVGANGAETIPSLTRQLNESNEARAAAEERATAAEAAIAAAEERATAAEAAIAAAEERATAAEAAIAAAEERATAAEAAIAAAEGRATAAEAAIAAAEERATAAEAAIAAAEEAAEADRAAAESKYKTKIPIGSIITTSDRHKRVLGANGNFHNIGSVKEAFTTGARGFGAGASPISYNDPSIGFGHQTTAGGNTIIRALDRKFYKVLKPKPAAGAGTGKRGRKTARRTRKAPPAQ